MEHKPEIRTQHKYVDPMDVAIRDGIQRGRYLHGQAVRAAFRGLSVWIFKVLMRTRTRRALAQLDDRMLRDIGLDKRQVARESQKPFWRV